MSPPKSISVKSLCVTALNLKHSIPLQDFHLHTTYTDGTSSVEQYITHAVKLGLSCLAFTEHVDTNTTWFTQFHREVKKLVPKNLIVLCGIEVRNSDYRGHLNVKDKLLHQADIIMGVVHRYPREDQPPPAIYDFSQVSPQQALKLEEKSFLSLVNSPQVEIIGHPFASFTSHFGDFPGNLIRRLFGAAKQADKIIEINPQYITHPQDFFRILLSVNPKVSLGSNAHHVNQLKHAYNFVRDKLHS